jgi:hypothetical protein
LEFYPITRRAWNRALGKILFNLALRDSEMKEIKEVVNNNE